MAISIPEGTYARIPSRSKIPIKQHIEAEVGVVHVDCRGSWGVVLFNHVDNQFHVRQGDGIAQLILEKISTNVLEKVQQLDSTTLSRPLMTKIHDFADPKSWVLRMQGIFQVYRNQYSG